MKKLILVWLALLGISFQFLMPLSAGAVNVLNQACQNSNLTVEQRRTTICHDNQTNGTNPLFGPDGLVTKAVQIITIILGIAAVITIIIAGLRMVLSVGDPNTVSTSRNAILYAVIGLLVALSSQAMITFVLKRIGV